MYSPHIHSIIRGLPPVGPICSLGVDFAWSAVDAMGDGCIPRASRYMQLTTCLGRRRIYQACMCVYQPPRERACRRTSGFVLSTFRTTPCVTVCLVLKLYIGVLKQLSRTTRVFFWLVRVSVLYIGMKHFQRRFPRRIPPTTGF